MDELLKAGVSPDDLNQLEGGISDDSAGITTNQTLVSDLFEDVSKQFFWLARKTFFLSQKPVLEIYLPKEG